MSYLWKQEEDQLFFNEDMSNLDIAHVTGRSLGAVEKRRYDLTGHYVDGITNIKQRNFFLTQQEKIARLYYLAEKIGVRFGEMLK